VTLFYMSDRRRACLLEVPWVPCMSLWHGLGIAAPFCAQRRTALVLWKNIREIELLFPSESAVYTSTKGKHFDSRGFDLCHSHIVIRSVVIRKGVHDYNNKQQNYLPRAAAFPQS
jgi:hypothetical protein